MDGVREINVFENTPIDKMALTIAEELAEVGRVQLKTKGSDALNVAISSVNLAKSFLPDYSITLGKAVSHGGNVTMLFSAGKDFDN